MELFVERYLDSQYDVLGAGIVCLQHLRFADVASRWAREQ